MAGASADGEVNHWPAFVDVLTTVIMVVTFLLVIMSAAVMQLSQRVIANFKQQMVQQQQAQQKPGPKLDKDGKPVACAPGAAAVLSPRDAEAGTSVAELGAVLRAPDVVNGAERLSIRTRETPDTLKLQVKAVEQAEDTRGVEVKTADTLIKVAFAPTAATYDETTTARVVSFLKGKARAGTKYEIWSFAPQTRSVSEAERVAFYRAAMTRNLLLRAGLAPADITTQIRVTDAASADGHMVRVVIKP